MKNIILAILSALLFLSACRKSSTPIQPGGSPVIDGLGFRGDTLHIAGQFGPPPTVAMRRVIINDQTVPDKDIVDWKEDEIK